MWEWYFKVIYCCEDEDLFLSFSCPLIAESSPSFQFGSAEGLSGSFSSHSLPNFMISVANYTQNPIFYPLSELLLTHKLNVYVAVKVKESHVYF